MDQDPVDPGALDRRKPECGRDGFWRGCGTAQTGHQLPRGRGGLVEGVLALPACQRLRLSRLGGGFGQQADGDDVTALGLKRREGPFEGGQQASLLCRQQTKIHGHIEAVHGLLDGRGKALAVRLIGPPALQSRLGQDTLLRAMHLLQVLNQTCPQ